MKKIKLLSKKQTRNKISLILKSVTFFVIGCISIIGFLNSPFITIRDYNITIEQKENELTELTHTLVSNVLNESTFFVKHNFYYFISPNKLQEKLKTELLWVSSVDIKYKFFNKYDLHIQERGVFGTHCFNLNCLLIDINGEVFSKTFLGRQIEFIAPHKLSVGDRLLDTLHFKKLVEIVDFLKKNDVLINKVYYSDNKIEQIKSDSLTILLDLNNSIYKSTQALYIALVKIPDKNIHYLDIKNPVKIKYNNE